MTAAPAERVTRHVPRCVSSPRNRLSMRAWVLLYIAAPCVASVLRVPTDFSTIQAALDALQAGDTVLVAVGVYHESVTVAEGISFALFGDASPDTGDYPRPFIDPSLVDGSDSLACLTIPENSVGVIQDFGFRNGGEMFPRRRPSDNGGVVNRADSLIVRRCVFDSTWLGLTPNPGWLRLDSCVFLQNPGSCVRMTSPQSRVVMRGCYFSGSGDVLIWILDSALVENCRFKEREVWATGQGITLRGCVFESNDNMVATPLWSDNIEGGVFEDNVFDRLRVMTAPMALHVSEEANRPTLVRGNRFVRTTPSSLGAIGAILTYVTDNETDLIVEDNLFDHCGGGVNGIRAVQLSMSAIIRANRFYAAINNTIPCVWAPEAEDLIVTHNFFHRTGLALDYSSPGQADARWNWWGDSTGPFHQSENPGGLGDMVLGDLLLNPWYTDSLVLETTEASFPAVQSNSFGVYPNPFNNSIRLDVIGLLGKQVRVTMHELLGREVDLIYDGVIEQSRLEYAVPAKVASGVYFIRMAMRDHVEMRRVVLLK